LSNGRLGAGSPSLFSTQEIDMDLVHYLEQAGVDYMVRRHPTTYTAQELAQAEHVPGKKVIKPVVVEADGRFIMCAVPAPAHVDMDRLRSALGAGSVRLAGETKLKELFPDCELGAEPPIGGMFDMPMVMDKSLELDDEVTFQAGSHQEAVTMKTADYCRVAHPLTAMISRI
jgi:Ala-tRNA(Pro) deacylase